MTDRRPRVTHVITDLDVGGAEILLCRFLERSETRFSSTVIALRGNGRLAKRLREAGVRVVELALRSLQLPAGVTSIRSELRRNRPDVVQTWMYHADLIGGLGARLAGIRTVVWGLHAAPDARRERLRPSMRAGLRAGALISTRLPAKIVCCSYETQRVHRDVGYASDKLVVIPNGFESGPRVAGAGRAVRSELGFPEDSLLVGWVGRNHPQKDLRNLVGAFRRVVDAAPRARLVLVGQGTAPMNRALRSEVEQIGLSEHVALLGPRDDVSRLQSGFDLAVSSSYSEGLPVVLGEAMSLGTPVVATDAGDSSVLLGDQRRIVPTRDPAALGRAILHVLELSPDQRRALGERDRERIRTTFDFERMLSAYEDLYAGLLKARS